ncbi:MAG: FAD-dependent oxidoreductase [Pseudomonadota bacterium]
MSETIYPTLFSPLDLSGQRLRNRLAHASILTRLVRDGRPDEALLNYLGARARGGTGMIVTEPLAMTRHNPDAGKLRAYDDVAMDGLKQVAEVVESADTRLLGQIQDPGRGRHAVGRNDSAISATALPDDLSWTVPRAVTEQEIRDLIEQWAEASRRLQQAGFSGVEISAGHGHIFHQFLSPWSNRRDDHYGGDNERRCRLVTEVMHAVRQSCGENFIIGVKLPGDDGIPGSIDLEQASAIAAEVAASGVASYWTFCWGAHANSLYRHLPDAHGERHPYLDAIRDLRQAQPEIPTGAIGYMTDPNECEKALTDGTADIAFLGRPLITDAAFGNKAERGQEATIRYCVSCNTCWRAIIEGNRLRCDNNPRVGEPDEELWEPKPAASPKKVVVVGAGIAGLEAAHVAAAKGHQVTVFGTSDEFGGKTRVHAELPGGENLSSIYDYQYLQGQRSGVTFHFDGKASAERVKALEPDVVLLATGSTTTLPHWLDEEWAEMIPDVRELASQMLARPTPTDGTLVLVDCDHTEMTYAAAELFAGLFEKVVLVTPRERFASDVSLINRQGIYQRLHDKGIELLTCLEPVNLDDLGEAQLALRNVYNQHEQMVDEVVAITYAGPRQPNLELLAPLEEAGIEVMRVGDAAAPRGVMAATGEGHRVGSAL